MTLNNRFKKSVAIGLAAAAWSASVVFAATTTQKPLATMGVQAGAVIVANEILNRWEPVSVAAGNHSPAWREQFYTQLSLMPAMWLSMFDALQPNATLASKADYARFTQMFVNAQANTIAVLAPQLTEKLGSPASDLVFVPITPCRIVDTRNTGTLISAGQQLNFYFYADTSFFSFSAQGGTVGAASSVCPGTALTSAGGSLGTAPPAATAATVTVVAPTAGGNFAVWGGAPPAPLVSILNWTAGQVLANTTVIPGGGRTGGNLDFAVLYNGSAGQAHVVVDVVGYFVESSATALQCNVQLAAGTGSIASGSVATVAFPACLSGYSRTGGGCSTASAPGANVYLQEESANSSSCAFYNNSGSSIAGATFQAESVCCRLPGQ